MHPILFHVGDYALHTFGLMAALGVLAGSAAVLGEARREGVDEDLIRRTTFVAVIAVIVGGRALDVIVNWRRFQDAPVEAFKIWKGGLVFYGGAIGVLLVVVVAARRAKRPILQLCDIYTVGGMIGLAIGRVGCLMAGDDYGKPTSLPWGIRFTDKASMVPEFDAKGRPLRGVPLHPTQIYMMLNALIIFLIVRAVARRKRFHGQVTAIGFLLYAAGRSAIELVRGDDDRGFVLGGALSTSQAISIVVAIAGIAIYATQARKPIPASTLEA